jgi:hypothetical protein
MEVHGKAPCHLGDPCCGRVRGRAEDADAPGGVFDHCQDGHRCAGEGLGFEEVGGEDGVGLGVQEGDPGGVRVRVRVGCRVL